MMIWKNSLRKEKRKLQANCLDALSRLPLNFNSVTAVIENKDMWRVFDRVICRLRAGEEVDTVSLKVALGAVTISSLYKSWQRPGVAANCTVAEFWNAVKVNDVFVVSVKDHKTGLMGPAKLILDHDIMAKIRLYRKHIRPAQV